MKVPKKTRKSYKLQGGNGAYAYALSLKMTEERKVMERGLNDPLDWENTSKDTECKYGT